MIVARNYNSMPKILKSCQRNLALSPVAVYVCQSYVYLILEYENEEIRLANRVCKLTLESEVL